MARWMAKRKAAGSRIQRRPAIERGRLAAVDPVFPELGDRSLASWARRLSGLPVIGVGKVSVELPMDQAYGESDSGVTDPTPSIQMVESGEIDLLGVRRALIANPDWVSLVRSGRWQELVPFHKKLLATLD